MAQPPKASRPHIPDYGLPTHNEGLLEWSFVEERLAESMHYWVATVSPGPKPHIHAIWGVYVGGAIYIGGGPDVRWAKNLRENANIVVHLEDGQKVVIVEAVASRTAGEGDDEVLAVQKAYKAKYKLDHPAPFWRITPNLAFAWTDFGKDATRFRF